MKKIILLSVILLTTSFCEDLFELGLEAYNKGEFDKAAKQWQKACDDNVARACHNLGVLYALGKGLNQDYRLAKRYVFKACTLGFQDGCDYLNKMIATDDNDEKIEIIFKTMVKTINHLKQID